MPEAPAPTAPDALLDQLATGVLVLDAELNVHYANSAAEQLLRTSRQRMQALAMEAWAPSLGAMAERVVATGEPVFHRELTLERPGMPEAVLDCSMAGMQAADGYRVMVELVDASRRLRMSRENALRYQVNVNRQMVRQLAHEMKNPLGGIRGAAQLLERQLGDPALEEYTQVIMAEADRLNVLANELLGPRGPTRREWVNIHEIVQHVFRLVRAELPERVRIDRDYDPSLPLVHLDRDQVVQAMLNLARNAIEAMGSEGRMVFRTRALTQHTIGDQLHRLVVCVEIEDDGPGVPEDIRETLFYPLVTGRDDGTGLGLPLAQELASRQGGLIEHQRRDGYTVFRLLIPKDQDQDGDFPEDTMDGGHRGEL